jgi:hypothetical protein
VSDEPKVSPPEGQPKPDPEPSDSPFRAPALEEIQKGLNPLERKADNDE